MLQEFCLSTVEGGLDQEEFLFFPGWCGITYMSSMPSALAIFTCRPNSHPFQERHVYLDEPVKIGRSVARCRPAQNNATFDCKVLSRNHALVWFDHKTGKVRHFAFPKRCMKSSVLYRFEQCLLLF